ncbi:MAG: hypothetical protein C0501_04960 [Isosphaera sp.]|nr:hypothetical protein [Isosphaera sp.]
MNPFRWLGERLGLIQSAEDVLLASAVAKVQILSAVARGHTRHQLDTYLGELDATGQGALAAAVRAELAASGVLLGPPAAPAGEPPAALPAAPPLALPPAAPQAPEKRKPGRPRKALPPAPAESFPADPH